MTTGKTASRRPISEIRLRLLAEAQDLRQRFRRSDPETDPADDPLSEETKRRLGARLLASITATKPRKSRGDRDRGWSAAVKANMTAADVRDEIESINQDVFRTLLDQIYLSSQDRRLTRKIDQLKQEIDSVKAERQGVRDDLGRVEGELVDRRQLIQELQEVGRTILANCPAENATEAFASPDPDPPAAVEGFG